MNPDAILDTTPSDNEQPLTPEAAFRAEVAALEQRIVRRAQRNFDASTNYLNSEIRTRWERDIAHFQNRHSPSSKFLTPEYRQRSKTFRPKVRMAARAIEAAASAALFSRTDLLDARAQNEDDPRKAAAAAVQKALLQYRLKKTIPWYLTVVGSLQDCFVYGVCASYVSWEYDRGETGQYTPDADGQPGDQGQPVAVLDRPWVEMIPPENIRFDPGCDWRDPVGSSPYLIRVVPMYFEDVRQRMQSGEWRSLDDGVIKSAQNSTDSVDSVKREREHGRPQQALQSENPLVYVRQHFDRIDGTELVYWTLGEHLLKQPVTLEEYTILKRRPIVIGRTIIESHRPYPTSNASLGASLQEAANDIANQRLDNVQLVLNKRYAVRRGKQIDFDALMRNVPGGGIVTDDPNGDIRVIETNDVTSSSYQEQDRLDNQFDEMQGTFSASAVNSNRAVGETLGGISIASGAANQVSEYQLKVFVETYCEPVLRMLAKLLSAYETDEIALAVAGENAKLLSRFGIDKITDDLLLADVDLSINLGNGATNPQQRVQRLSTGIKTIGELPGVAERLNVDEIIKEVMGSLGYQNGERFVQPKSDEPPPVPPEIQMKMKELELREAELQLQQQRLQVEAEAKQLALQVENEQFRAELDLKRELGLADLASRENLTIQQLAAKVGIEERRIASDRTVKALQANLQMNEMELKLRTGSGI